MGNKKKDIEKIRGTARMSNISFISLYKIKNKGNVRENLQRFNNASFPRTKGHFPD
jgi:hypothetical protein